MNLRMISVLFLAVPMLCATGCGQERAASATEVPAMPMEPAKIMLSPEGGKSFVIRLPKGKTPEDVTGLCVELQAEKVKDAAGFTVLFHLGRSTGSDSSPPLGLTTIFKPLKAGEKVTAYLAAPKREAWKKDADSWSITIEPQLQAGHPGRNIPDVTLSLIEAAASTGKD